MAATPTTSSGTHQATDSPNSGRRRSVAVNGTTPTSPVSASARPPMSSPNAASATERQAVARPGGDDVVDGASDHRGEGEHEPEHVETAGARGRDHEHQAQQCDDGADQHDGLRHRRVRTQTTATSSRGAMYSIRMAVPTGMRWMAAKYTSWQSGDADERHAEHPPPATPQRGPVAAERVRRRSARAALPR